MLLTLLTQFLAGAALIGLIFGLMTFITEASYAYQLGQKEYETYGELQGTYNNWCKRPYEQGFEDRKESKERADKLYAEAKAESEKSNRI